jgi:hypothetical protein
MPTSTFVYTAVFAAGLTMDAKAKRNRSRQWTTAFDQLRDEIERTVIPEGGPGGEHAYDEDESIGVGSFVSIEEMFPEGINWDIIYRLSGMELEQEALPLHRKSGIRSESDPDLGLPEQQSITDLENLSESLWDLLRYDSRMPLAPVMEWPANTGPDLVRHNLPPQSLWAPDHMRWRALRKRQIQKKLIIQELSVGVLIYTLLDCTHAAQLPLDAVASLSPHLLKVARLNDKKRNRYRCQIIDVINTLYTLPKDTPPDEIKRVRDTFNVAIPQYHQDADGDFYSICQQMNGAIKDIIAQRHLDDVGIGLAAAKICHNLLVSTAAPDVQTINMLIAGLGRWRRPELVDTVISASEACKIRPNEITCAAVLNHYIQTDRPHSFSKFVGRMQANGNGLMLARPDVSINEKSEGRLVRFGEKVKQKVFPTPVVFNTLMLGVLKFAGFDRAIEVYYAMKEEGWGLDILGLSHLLEDCIRRADWEGGSYVWEEISSIKRRVKPDHMSKAYAQMLSLCSVTGKTVAFNQVLRDLVRRGFDRKRILSSAIGTTQLSSERTESVTPPMTADNLMIAVSDYLGESRWPGQYGTPAARTGDTHRGELPGSFFDEVSYDEATGHRDATNNKPRRYPPPPVKDAEEAWAVWMQHELGEPVKQDLQSHEEPQARNPEPPPVRNAEEAWAVWMQHELGEPALQPLQSNKAGSRESGRESEDLPHRQRADEEHSDAHDGHKYDP